MSVNPLTSEQRRGIHERARQLGFREGTRSGINQLSSYLGPKVGEISLYALSIVLDVTDQETAQATQFNKVDWNQLGATSLQDLLALTPEEIASTQPDHKTGTEFVAAIDAGLAVFNLHRDNDD